jgi:NADP-dependent 3-hydroxy acid dehydrogenase YdfG
MPEMFGKRVVITGASSGIGRACAYWFLNNGANVALVGRDIEQLKEIGHLFPMQAVAI